MDETLISSFNSNINLISRELRKDALSVKNRLQSILFDAQYVESFNSEFPLVANERCGLWYVPLHKQVDSCYFKSTDGHTGICNFSLRRLNLHLLPLIQGNGGVCIVDSTRKGKKMPDALLKTIPIWCAVINQIRFGSPKDGGSWLKTPSVMVSMNEHTQVCDKIEKFANEAVALGIVTPDKLKVLSKPLIPSWYYPGGQSKTNGSSSDDLDYLSVECVTASKQLKLSIGSTISIAGNSWYYVQGSADDHELWATSNICRGNLNPVFFWEHIAYSSELIDSSGFIHHWLGEKELIAKMNEIYESSQKVIEEKPLDVTEVKDTGILFGKIEHDIDYKTLEEFEINSVVVLSDKWKVTNIPKVPRTTVSVFTIESSKKGSKQLRDMLPTIIPCVGEKAMVLCDTGRDLSVGVVLVLLCKKSSSARVDKVLVKQQLSLLLEVRKVEPSRNTLQSINTYLMKY